MIKNPCLTKTRGMLKSSI